MVQLSAGILTCLAFLPAQLSSAFSYGTAYSNNFGVPGINATYDYVIVGGGTAGLALAYRLAENRNFTVAVVEAGGFYEQENGNRTLVPGYYVPNIEGALTNWNFKTLPQAQLANDTVAYARGKTLGGSSALNAMLYQRGTNGSYKDWADAVGDPSYEFDQFLQYFQISANYTPPNTNTRASNSSVPSPAIEAFTSSGGPLHVSFPNTAAPFRPTDNKVSRRSYCPLTVRPEDQTRSSSESSFLQAAFTRNELYSNLVVYIQTLGEYIVFDSNKTATGALVSSKGVSYMLNATKEVIVSAGAFQSPQLLMVSGIGPEEELVKHNISCIADRPGVGQNMWDHVLFGVTYEIKLATTSSLQDPVTAAHASDEYNKNKTGILTTNNADYLGWEKIPLHYQANLSANARSDLAKFPADWPDLEYVVLNFNQDTKVPVDINHGTLLPALITPLSRGNISLASASMTDAPIINVGWLTSQTDLEATIVGIKRAREWFATDALKQVIIGEELQPGKNVTTDAQIIECARRNVQTVYHASCTCKMGKLSDPMAVTDSRARVIGVQNLRVVDASTFPLLVPGHPQSTIYALAEKIADHILKGT
ncbi:related to choline dehydrogenase [Rhynchosporium secalis]|uniref:Related to choline dehydrogenase n=1 Tax=Rhynchosporium secalis TaxID=38038 RepID=A0A1E1MW18_RHYSE|nr:related to choline dehydrogenase [Rhynchosporium secalis]